jgi:predicted AAA+ superfamily ATPase
MSKSNEILILLRKLVKLISEEINSKRKIPEGILEWDSIESKFYKIENKTSNNLLDLFHVNKQKDILLKNTMLFATGKPSNNVLLWGARGTGKSSLVLNVYKTVLKTKKISLLEIKTNQIKYLGFIIRALSETNRKFILFCDDFSFTSNNEDFILFKNTLDGSVSKNKNIIYYVTSNYRNIIKENYSYQSHSMLNKQEKIEDETALSDRFGLWLGFETFNEEKYLDVVVKYCDLYNIKIEKNILKKRALQWSLSRGSRSGREALNFVKSLFLN